MILATCVVKVMFYIVEQRIPYPLGRAGVFYSLSLVIVPVALARSPLDLCDLKRKFSNG